MGPDHPTSASCPLCGQPVADGPVGDGAAAPFCSPGCRTVHETLGDGPVGGEGVAAGEAAIEGGDPTPTADWDLNATADAASTHTAEADGERLARTFLRVEGMHGVTCERFIESRARGCRGVVDAEASYVSETVRVAYDPERGSVQRLCERLTTLGYTAVLREAAPIDSNVSAEPEARRLESVLGYRYAVGVLFGSFLMLTYVALLYPIHLASMLGEDALPLFADATLFADGSGAIVLPLYLGLTGVVLAFTGLPLLRGAYVALVVRQPNAELLASLTVVGAYLHSAVAVLVGRPDVYFDLTFIVAAAVVAALYYESLVKQRAMDRLLAHALDRLETATRYATDGTTEPVDVADLEAGDRVLVRRGERVPVDGVLTTGRCAVDEALVTGESLPVEKRAGDVLVGGTTVVEHAAVLTVTDGEGSGLERLVETVWDLQSAEHGGQRRVNRVASVVAPAVVAGSVLVGGGALALGASPTTSLLAGLTVLLVASPWALGLATPLSVGTSVEAALRRGLVVFDETVFERLRGTDVVVFDKTGTLTTGQLRVLEADAPEDLRSAAVALERRVWHPVADAIVAEFGAARDGETADGDPVSDDEGRLGAGERDASPDGVTGFRSHERGVEGVVDDASVLVGHPGLFERRGWAVSDALRARAETARGVGRLPVLLGRDGRAEGLLVVGDEPREGWETMVTHLGERGLDVVVLTGDDAAAASAFEHHPHVTHVFAGVPPAGKTATVRLLQSRGSVTMVGDGANDAPALARADLGIALGSGSATAADAADLALVEDDLAGVETAFDLAGAARRRATQNTVLALLFNAVTIPAALLGVANPLVAMAAVLVSGGLLAGNAFRPYLEE